MRKSFWMISVLLVLTAVGSTAARADTIVTSGGVVTAINGITIAGTTYNVTFGSIEDMTFAGNSSGASAAESDIQGDLSGHNSVGDSNGNGLGIYVTPSPNGLTLGIDEATSGVWAEQQDGTASFQNNVNNNPTVFSWVEFSPQTTNSVPEPSSSTLTLTGLGLLGLLVVIRKRVAIRDPQAT